MEAGQEFVDGSELSWTTAQSPIRPADANIDPLLSAIIGPGAAMNASLMFDSHPMQPMQAFDSSIQAMSLPEVVPADTPSSHGTRSSRIASAHSDMITSPTESRRSSLRSSSWATADTASSQYPLHQQVKTPKPLRRSYTSPSTTVSSRQQAVIAAQPRRNRCDDGEHGEVKRDEFLKRNRIAASRCRQKKKEWVHQLEETKDELEQQNTSLQMERKSLVDEVGRMKYYLMAHATCNDPNIDGWIENEAKRIVERSNSLSDGKRACQPSLCSHGRRQQSSCPDAVEFD